MPVVATIVHGVNGGTTVAGRSGPLSSSEDRARFQRLRASADVIIIGGQTSRHEPYKDTPAPLFVITRNDEIPGSAALNPRAMIWQSSISDLVEAIKDEYQFIQMEGGPNLLAEALSQNLIDHLYVTRTQKIAEPPFLKIGFKDCGLTLIREESAASGEEDFLHYARLPLKS